MTQLRVVYLLLHFPYLTETFVAEEIQAVQAQGVDVQIVSLLGPDAGQPQPLSERLLPRCWYAPSLTAWSLWRAQFYFLSKQPRLYLSLLVTLLSRPYPNQPLSLFAKRLVIFLKAVAVAARLRDDPVNLFHAHFAWLPGAAAWVCARLLQRPFSVTAHAYDLFASADLLNLVAQEADQVVAISEYNRHFISKTTGRPREAIAVIRCGIDLGNFAGIQPVAHTQEAGDRLRLIAVGSLNHKKGHEVLIEACQLLKERQIPFVCNIIGRGEGEARLAELISRLGLQQHVYLRGALPNPAILAEYGRHDLFVLASVVAPNGDRDGIPVVMMEAGACGLPLVSTAVSGIPELVRHGKTGLLAPPEDARSLADAITTLAANPLLRQELGEAARALVQEEYNIAINAQRLVECFRSSVATSLPIVAGPPGKCSIPQLHT
jgi:colanic acid/amylovoran biosynthesis glycosyltransferase